MSQKVKSPVVTGLSEWPGTELNRRHADFQSAALPTELPGQGPGIITPAPAGSNGFEEGLIVIQIPESLEFRSVRVSLAHHSNDAGRRRRVFLRGAIDLL